MNKKTVFIVLGVIALVIGFLVFTKPGNSSAGTPSEHKTGTSSSGVVIVEYGDFQCPACGQYYPVMKQVKEYYGDEITFQFRHFPLESIHKNARAASRAAEAAHNQGKFWEMHDILYETQQQWGETPDPMGTFESFAKTIGVADLERFKSDYKGSEVNSVINADLKAGLDLGANSTPTFIFDGQKLDPLPSPSFEAFKQLIDAKITEKTGKPPVSGQNSEVQAPVEQPEAVPQQ